MREALILGCISALSLITLSGCASTDFVTGMTAEQIQANPEAYKQALARAYNQPYTPPPVIQAQPVTAYQAPQVQTIQRDGVTYVYCRSLGTYVVTCRE